MNSRPRIALLGCGRIARGAHLPILARAHDLQLVAIAETDAGARDAVERMAAITPPPAVFSDFHDLLGTCDVDAAVICLPNDLHAEATLACFERKLHVYVEKPLATTVEEGERMVEAWRRTGTLGAVGYCFRFHPLVLRLRDAVRSGTLGEPAAAHTVFCGARRELPQWKQKRASGGGALLDLASHHVDLMRFVFETEIAEAHALRHDVASEDDTAVLAMRLDRGPLVTTLVSLAAEEEDRVAIYGTKGGLVFDRYRSTRLTFVPPTRPSTRAARLRAGLDALDASTSAVRNALLPPREPSFELSLAAFATAVRGGAWTGADLDDGLRSLTVIAAAERSFEQGPATKASTR